MRRFYSSWKPPKNILILKKIGDMKATIAFDNLATYLREFPVNVFIESPIKGHSLEIYDKQDIDLVITLGGDGTLLHCSRMFQKQVPPILSFSLGSLGFLIPFDFKDVKYAVKQVLNNPVKIFSRMRLLAKFGDREDVFLNDLVIHRGSLAQLIIVDVAVNNSHLTDVVADGLILSTPTGSTAYNLSAGGPIVHPLVQAMTITPICARSLSFRPVLLPNHVQLKLQLSTATRGNGTVHIDGRETYPLTPKDHITVETSAFPLQCISIGDWFSDIKFTLKWNQNFVNTGWNPK